MNRRFIIILILPTVILIAVGLFSFPEKANSPIIEFQKIINKALQKDNVKILFVGDLMFDRGIRYYADKNNGNDFIFDKIHSELLKYDLVVGNLEGPITDKKSISLTTKPGEVGNYLFTFDPSWAKTLFENNIRIVNLGNNHILNFEQEGLASTKKYLDEAGVGYFGAPDYPKSILQEIKNVKITFINYNQFADLDKETNIKNTLEEIEKAKSFSDIIIVFCHWGAEYAGPDQEMQDLARQFVERGADLVVGSHPHVISYMEIYNGKRIYYSLGNFVFDQYFSEDVRNGMGIELKIDKETKQLSFEEKHFYLENNGQTVLK